MVERREAPGVQYLFLSADAVLFEHHAGLANVTHGQPVSTRTTFNAYSLTKTLTAAATLQLAEQGLVDLDRPIAQYLDQYPYPASPTVRQTLLHRGGFPNPNPLSWVHLAGEHAAFDEASFVRDVMARHAKVDAAPGASYKYSNIGYLLLGAMIEKHSGMRYAQYIERRIFAPLGLTDDQTLAFTIVNPQNHANGHLARWSLLNFVLGFFIDRRRLIDARTDGWVSFRHHQVNGAAYGGLIANAGGLARYLQALLGYGAVFSPTLRGQLLAPVPEPAGGEPRRTLGWFVGRLGDETYLAHAGGGAGYYCEARMYPRLGRASVVMFNCTGMRDQRLLDRIDEPLVMPQR